MYARVAHSTRWFITNKKGPMLSNHALQRAKRMKQLEALMYIDPLFWSSYVFPSRICDDVVNEKKLNYESKRGNPISSKENA